MITTDAHKWLEQQTYVVPFSQYLHPIDLAFHNLKTDAPGWYAQLRASGPHDDTSWVGPFDSEDEAFTALYERFNNGD